MPYLQRFVKLREKRLGLRAVTYSYLTRLKAAATGEGLSLSKLQEISQRGREIGIKRYRRYSHSERETEREWSQNSREDFLQSSPNHLSKRKSFVALIQTRRPPSPQPRLHLLYTQSYLSPRVERMGSEPWKSLSPGRLGRCVADYISFGSGLVIGSSSSSR